MIKIKMKVSPYIMRYRGNFRDIISSNKENRKLIIRMIQSRHININIGSSSNVNVNPNVWCKDKNPKRSIDLFCRKILSSPISNTSSIYSSNSSYNSFSTKSANADPNVEFCQKDSMTKCTNGNGEKTRRGVFYDLRDPPFVPYLNAWRVQKFLFDERVKDLSTSEDEGEKQTNQTTGQNSESKLKSETKSSSSPSSIGIDNDVVLLLEHPSVYTLGRAATLNNLKFDPQNTDHDLYRVERGGQVTWHGPGQLVMYPILDLRYHKNDVKCYVDALEEVIIRVLKRYGIEGNRQDKFTGVWVNISNRKELLEKKIESNQIQINMIETEKKISNGNGNRGGSHKGDNGSESTNSDSEPIMAKVAAVGVSSSKWITMHGIAINVNPDLSCFDQIIPCGLTNKPVTSIQELLESTKIDPPSSEQVRKDMLEEFTYLFNHLDIEVIENASLPEIPSSYSQNEPGAVFKEIKR